MGYDARHTPLLLAALHGQPDREFTAAELKKLTGVPKMFVRRALTVDAEGIAATPMEGVAMRRGETDGLWRFRAAPR